MVQIGGLLMMAILLYDMFQLQNVQIHTLSMLFPHAVCCTKGYMIGSVCLSVSPTVCKKKYWKRTFYKFIHLLNIEKLKISGR